MQSRPMIVGPRMMLELTSAVGWMITRPSMRLSPSSIASIFRGLLVEHDPVELEQILRVAAIAPPRAHELRPQRATGVRNALGDRGEIEFFRRGPTARPQAQPQGTGTEHTDADQAETGLRAVQLRDPEKALGGRTEALSLLGSAMQEKEQVAEIRVEQLGELQRARARPIRPRRGRGKFVADERLGGGERTEQVVRVRRRSSGSRPNRSHCPGRCKRRISGASAGGATTASSFSPAASRPSKTWHTIARLAIRRVAAGSSRRSARCPLNGNDHDSLAPHGDTTAPHPGLLARLVLYSDVQQAGWSGCNLGQGPRATAAPSKKAFGRQPTCRQADWTSDA